MQPKQFKIRPGGFNEVRRKFLFRLIPILVLAMAVGLTINYVNTKHEEDNAFVLPYVIAFFLLMLGISIYRSLNRGRALFESFILTIEANSIFRDQLNTPTIHIYHSEVTHISRLRKGGYLIKSGEADNLILIPAQIEHREELEMMLNRIRPIDDTPKLSLAQRYPVVLTLFVLGLMALVFISTNKLLVALGGSLLAAFLIWTFYQGRKSKNIDQKTKGRLWWAAVVLVAAIGRVVLILFGYSS